MPLIMGSLWLEFFGVVIVLSTVFLIYIRNYFKYWKYLGITTPDWGSPLFGQATQFLNGTKSYGKNTVDIYKSLRNKNVKFGGCYLPTPLFMPIDPNVIKHIMQVDFNHFVNRGLYFNKTDDPITVHLFNIESTTWRSQRAKLSPTFTSGRMKMMFKTILETGKQIKELLDKVNDGESVEIKDILARYTSDIICSCAFGLEANSLQDPDAEFRKNGKRVFEISAWKTLKSLFANCFPGLAGVFRITLVDSCVAQFFVDVITRTVDFREKNNVYRKDFMHLLIQLKNRGKLSNDTLLHDEDGKKSSTDLHLTMDEITAQSYLFFIAGFETSSTTMGYFIYEMCMHQDVQDKVREEIGEVMKKYGDLTYEAIMEMKYMEMVICETLRKYPVLPILHRICTIDYRLPNTDIVLKSGTKVIIPVEGLHHDPEYYPEPEKFIPERFTEENIKKRHQFTYLPFGEGPRICIGLRFGMLQSKVGMSILLHNYKLTLNKLKTDVPLKVNTNNFLTTVEGGIWVNIKPIDHTK